MCKSLAQDLDAKFERQMRRSVEPSALLCGPLKARTLPRLNRCSFQRKFCPQGQDVLLRALPQMHKLHAGDLEGFSGFALGTASFSFGNAVDRIQGPLLESERGPNINCMHALCVA